MTGSFRSASGGRLATYVVWGSSTDVGKTLVSAALARAARGIGVSVNYVKPVQTGITENAWDLDGAAELLVLRGCVRRRTPSRVSSSRLSTRKVYAPIC